MFIYFYLVFLHFHLQNISLKFSQIKSVNPDMNIGTFTFPANEDEADNVLNSGIDVQFCVMKACKNKEAAYEASRKQQNKDN